MKTIPPGKHIYFWDFTNFQVHGVSHAGLTSLIRRLGVSVVAIKMANGYLPYTNLQRTVEAILEAGAQIAGWQYYFSGVRFSNGGWYKTGVTPEQEVEASLGMIEMYKPVYWLIDAEREYKVWEQQRRMSELMQALKPNVTIPVGLSTYRFPDVHREFPFKEAFTVGGGVDFNMPQVYWNKPSATTPSYGPIPESNKSFEQYEALYKSWAIPSLPFYPTGRAYVGDAFASPGPTAKEMTDFLTNAKARSWLGVSFWSADALVGHPGGKERTEAIAAFAWGTPIPPPPPPPSPQPTKFTISVDQCNLRSQPSTALGAATVIGYGKKGGVWEIADYGMDANGKRWYKIQGYVREDMGNAG